MKKTIVLIALTALFLSSSYAQEKNKKEVFEVKGNCGMCKTRIEKASIKVKGVKYAFWDVDSKELSVIFNEGKCSISDIKRAIAKVGHDTDELRAEHDVYESLPECCKFRDPKSMHMNHSPKN